MEITLDTRYHLYSIKVESGDAKIESDVTRVEFIRNEESGKITSEHYREPTDQIVSNFTQVLEDLVYYRVNDVDSTSLIEILFSKLPEDKVEGLLNTLNKDYGNE